MTTSREVCSLAGGKGLKPSVIVDYDREVFIHPVSNVRLTFDKALHAGISSSDLFDPSALTLPVFDDGSVIFEVKYDDVLPAFLRGIISSAHGPRLALSKFTLCLDKLQSFKPKL